MNELSKCGELQLKIRVTFLYLKFEFIVLQFYILNLTYTFRYTIQ